MQRPITLVALKLRFGAVREKQYRQLASDVDPQLRIRFLAEAVREKQYRQLASDVDPYLRIRIVAGA